MSWTSSSGHSLWTNLKVRRGRQNHTHCCGCKQPAITERNARRGRLVSLAFAPSSPSYTARPLHGLQACNARSIVTTPAPTTSMSSYGSSLFALSSRLAEDGSHTVVSIMAEEKVRGLHRVAVRDDKGKLGSTQVELLPPHDHPAADRQAEALPGARTHGAACPRAGGAGRTPTHRLESDHRPAGRRTRCRRREAAMLRHALED